MNSDHDKKAKIHFYEYPLYWLVTILTFLLAVPILIIRFIGYLINSMGSPLKSVKHLLGFVMIIIIIIGLYTTYEIFKTYDIGPKTQSITINENDGFAKVMSELNSKDIIKGGKLFKMAAVTFNIDKSLSPGRYDFTGDVSIYRILKKLKNRDIASIMVTIPEGLTVKKIAGIFAQRLGIDSAEFVNRTYDTAYVQEKYDLQNMEGYLFPETYKIQFGMKIDGIIDFMYKELLASSGDILSSNDDDKYSKHQIMTLASIIAAEAMEGDEMGLISSVYNNRLNRKMLLQADPTVIYAIGGLDRPLWYRDLKFDSPYNTYKYKGLPPGPINSPGFRAIKAAMQPDDSEYLYFVADGSGRHVFSKTLREHNNAKNRIKRAKRNN